MVTNMSTPCYAGLEWVAAIWMQIALKLVTVTQICVNVDKRKQLHISLSAETILHSKKFCTVNLMIYCRSLIAFLKPKSLKYSCMGTTSNLKSLTAEIFHLLLLCKSIFFPLKGSVIRKFLPGAFKCSRHTLDCLYHSSHLIHITSWWWCSCWCMYFLPHFLDLFQVEKFWEQNMGEDFT